MLADQVATLINSTDTVELVNDNAVAHSPGCPPQQEDDDDNDDSSDCPELVSFSSVTRLRPLSMLVNRWAADEAEAGALLTPSSSRSIVQADNSGVDEPSSNSSDLRGLSNASSSAPSLTATEAAPSSAPRLPDRRGSPKNNDKRSAGSLQELQQSVRGRSAGQKMKKSGSFRNLFSSSKPAKVMDADEEMPTSRRNHTMKKSNSLRSLLSSSKESSASSSDSNRRRTNTRPHGMKKSNSLRKIFSSKKTRMPMPILDEEDDVDTDGSGSFKRSIKRSGSLRNLFSSSCMQPQTEDGTTTSPRLKKSGSLRNLFSPKHRSTSPKASSPEEPEPQPSSNLGTCSTVEEDDEDRQYCTVGNPQESGNRPVPAAKHQAQNNTSNNTKPTMKKAGSRRSLFATKSDSADDSPMKRSGSLRNLLLSSSRASSFRKTRDPPRLPHRHVSPKATRAPMSKAGSLRNLLTISF